jgi:DNA-binding NarL/FixJ family response regulator
LKLLRANVIESFVTLTGITRGHDSEDHPHSGEAQNQNMPITVLLADDAAILRRAIRHVLKAEPKIQIIGEAENFAQTIKMMTDLKPQIVVMDLYMPDASVINPSDLKASIAASAAHLLVISIWNDEDSQTLAKTYGAVAFLDKAKLGTDLIPTIKRSLYRSQAQEGF